MKVYVSIVHGAPLMDNVDYGLADFSVIVSE